MRHLLVIAALFSATGVTPAAAQRSTDQEAAFRAMREGHILPLHVIRQRHQVAGAEFIGADFDESGPTYRLKFMRGAQVIWIDVDARTGRALGRSR